MTDRRLEGRTALVTGGGTGIGAAAARRLAAEGARVVVAGRTEETLKRVARETGGTALVCDVSDPAAVTALFSKVGGADILVTAAGISPSAPIRKTTDAIWSETIAVNLTGTFLVVRAALNGMLERGFGRIVTVASTAGRTGYAYVSAYCASKHGVVGLTRALAVELAGKGVTVNAVCPGYVDSPMTDRTIERIMTTTGRSREAALAEITGTNPQKRLMTPDEVAAAIVTLCLPDSAGINGQAIVLDGGALQR